MQVALVGVNERCDTCTELQWLTQLGIVNCKENSKMGGRGKNKAYCSTPEFELFRSKSTNTKPRFLLHTVTNVIAEILWQKYHCVI